MIEVTHYDIHVVTDPLGGSWGWVRVKGSLDDIPPTWDRVPDEGLEFYVHESDPIWVMLLNEARQAHIDNRRES